MPLDLRALRQLLALADHGSFGRAAAALRMTQPALSRSMKGLEAEVGAELFERSPTGAVPTDEGRLLIERARDLVRAADELDRELLRRRVPGAGQIVLGAGPYPGETIVPAALTRFMAAHPLVRVRVVVRGDWDELLRRLRARELEEQATASLLWSSDAPEAILRLLLGETDIARAFDPPERYDSAVQGEWHASLVTFRFARPIRLIQEERSPDHLALEYKLEGAGFWRLEFTPESVSVRKV